MKGINFGNAFTASGMLGFFGEGYWFHKTNNIFFPGFNLEGSTFIAKTTPLEKTIGNMPLKDNFQPLKLFPDCIRVDFFKGTVLNAVGLSSPGAEVLLNHGAWQKRENPFIISFAATGGTKEKRLNEMREFITLLEYHLPFFRAKIGLEIDITCSNIKLNLEELAVEAVDYLKISSTLGIPLITKLNALTPINVIKEITGSGLCDALDYSNTIPWGKLKDEIDWKYLFGSEKSPLEHYGGGALSGFPLRLIVARGIERMREESIDTQIICSSVFSKYDVLTSGYADANAVAIGSVGILRPWRTESIIKEANTILAKK
jgi:dihydroorotate dehydrogenase